MSAPKFNAGDTVKYIAVNFNVSWHGKFFKILKVFQYTNGSYYFRAECLENIDIFRLKGSIIILFNENHIELVHSQEFITKSQLELF